MPRTTLPDIRLTRIDRQLASVISVTTASAREAEALADQALADDLNQVLFRLKAIHTRLGTQGRKYKPL